jgi:hypothetical protein
VDIRLSRRVVYCRDLSRTGGQFITCHNKPLLHEVDLPLRQKGAALGGCDGRQGGGGGGSGSGRGSSGGGGRLLCGGSSSGSSSGGGSSGRGSSGGGGGLLLAGRGGTVVGGGAKYIELEQTTVIEG